LEAADLLAWGDVASSFKQDVDKDSADPLAWTDVASSCKQAVDKEDAAH
jgi:hypothetical protein